MTTTNKPKEETQEPWIDLEKLDFGFNFDWKALETMLDLHQKHSELPRRPRPGYSFWPF